MYYYRPIKTDKMTPTLFMTIIVIAIMFASAIKVIEFFGQSIVNIIKHFYAKKTKATKHKSNMPMRMRKGAKGL